MAVVKRYPKQFVSLMEDSRSLFMTTLTRFSRPLFAAPLIVIAEDYRFLVREQLAASGVQAGAILVEPEARNTAAAVLAAALHAVQMHGPETLLLIAPSDHYLRNEDAFIEAVRQGIPHTRNDALVVFGIRLGRAETGYGYLALPAAPTGSVQQVMRFVEKPDAATAQAMLQAGNCLWNAGIFLFAAGEVIKRFRQHAPHLMAPVCKALQEAVQDLGFMQLSARSWQAAESISYDHAIMEKAFSIRGVPFDDAGWLDLGDWLAMHAMLPHDEHGNSMTHGAHALACRDTLLYAASPRQAVVGLGLDDMVVVAMRDAVLVARKEQAQQVWEVVELLKEAGVEQATRPAISCRPWGTFECLAARECFRVKRIMVKPGEALSLQCHMHRAEHWVVVQGAARVTIGDEQKIIRENESVFVPMGTRHRLENPGRLPLIIIEVQSGSYLGEDDIMRFSDRYDRC